MFTELNISPVQRASVDRTICPLAWLVPKPRSTSETRFSVLLRLRPVRGEEPRTDRTVSDPEFRGDLSQALVLRLHLQNPFSVHRTLRAAQPFAILSRIPNPGRYPFPYQIALKQIPAVRR